MSIALQDGATFANRYQIIRCIAAGGMGAVYEVIHLETERKRALKVMLPHILGSQELRDRFKREAKVAAQIESEHIVDVFDAGLDEATQMPFLVMELLKGEELGKRLERIGKFAPHEVYTYLWQTSLALDKTHKANIVHRDLKPENLFLCDSESGAPKVKVLDFGIAKLVADGSTQANATRSVGTPLYMSPEQFRSGTKVSAQSDIYALGMMAYTLLVGEPYWADEASGDSNVFAFAASVMNGPQEPPSSRAMRKHVQLAPTFDLWFRKVCAVNPQERFTTATQAIAGLGEVLGLPPLGRPSAGTSGDVTGTGPHAVYPMGGTGPGASHPGFAQAAISGPGMPSPAAGTNANVAVSAHAGLTGAGAKKSGAGAAIAALVGVLAIGGAAAFFFLHHSTPATESASAATAAATASPVQTSAPAVTETPKEATPPATTEPASTSVAATPTATPSATAAAIAPSTPKGRTAPPPPTAKTAKPAATATTPSTPAYSRD